MSPASALEVGPRLSAEAPLGVSELVRILRRGERRRGRGRVTAMLGGETDLLFANSGVFLGHIKAGKLRPIAVCALTRLPLFPDVPTLHESGFANFESSTYYGLLAPAGTPRPIIQRLHGELTKIIRSPESMERLASVGAIPVANTPEQFAEALRVDVAKWAKVIKEHGIKAD